jgi:hypothetical protein
LLCQSASHPNLARSHHIADELGEFAIDHCLRVITYVGGRKMAKIKSSGKRTPRPKEEFKPNPESEKWFRERAASPEGERLLDELARCFVQAAVTRLLKEQKMNQGG